ncbi:MAG TPA: NAD(P)H-dependent oxidoreductase [Bacteroidota bacterium]|nr:NAD(P)H-dependent oxidoreductase [Bacteroidota bacterium]
MEKQEILDAFLFRHACKEFDPNKKIPEEDFQFILEAARLSPSSFGFEPWKFIVVNDRVLREALKVVTWGAQKTLPTASHYVVILARTKQDMLSDSAYIQSMMRETHKLPEEASTARTKKYANFLENDFKLLESERAIFDWASKQTYIALGNMMTAAALIGIDSCPVEGFNRADVDRVLDSQGLLEHGRFAVSLMVAFGYRINEPRQKTRQPLDVIVKYY